ncbi:hypothetical protein AAHC03_09609 [Spirometra sp. Aus1]
MKNCGNLRAPSRSWSSSAFLTFTLLVLRSERLFYDAPRSEYSGNFCQYVNHYSCRRHLSLCEFASAELPVKFWRLIRQYPYIFWLASFRTEISKLLRWSGRLSGAELFPNYGLPGCRIPFQLNRWCTSPP